MSLKNANIVFENVNFSYNNKKEILHNISFMTISEQIIALVSSSDAEKSTILSLISHFRDFTHDIVKISNQDIAKIQIESFRDNVDIVSQTSRFFNNIIKNNIRYTQFNAIDENIIEACKIVDLHD